MSESGRVTAAPGSVLPELGCTPINGPIDDKQSVDLDGAVHVCECVHLCYSRIYDFICILCLCALPVFGFITLRAS